ncbi:hypothetical protein JCM11251_007925 [Rhodosporidiobolus azoricus]
MSSFRRRTPSSPLPGTRPSSSGSPLLSTGLPAIDDLLGGGLPLHSSLLIEADAPTSYSDLLLRYWVAQGLESGHEVCVVASGCEGGPEGVVEGLMGTEGAEGGKGEKGGEKEKEEDREEREQEERLKEKMKIAFRYEGMKQHQTTLAEGGRAGASTGIDSIHPFSSVFDLTTTRTLTSSDRSRLHLIHSDDLPSSSSGSGSGLYDALYERIEKLVDEGGFRVPSSPTAPRKILRLALLNFGYPSWSLSPTPPHALYRFLTQLKHLSSPSSAHLSTLLTFPAYLYSTSSTSPPLSPLLTRLSHASSSVLRLTSLSSSPTLASQFPRHAGLLSFPKLPTLPPGSLVPPGARQSVLRGLGGGGEGRDNLVGFRVKRRRFVVEVVSDDPVGGEDEAERKQRERRKRVEEANRKEREMAGEGVQSTDVLLGKMGERVRSIRIGGEEEQDEASSPSTTDLPPPVPTVSLSVAPSPSASSPTPAAAAPKKSAFRKKGVRVGGVSFAGADDDDEKQEEPKQQSVSSMLHQRPDLLDF